ncbi:MAG: hypothetical protein U0234_16590 [Sandaracinus sp.]
MRAGAFGSGGLLVAAIALATAGAHAQDEPATTIDRPRVSVTLDASCGTLDATQVRRVLDVELGAEADLDAPVDAATSRVEVRCEESDVVRLVVDEPLTQKHLERTLTLGETGRARLVAIAIAEILAASWIELGMTHDPDVSPSSAAGSEEARAIALETAREHLADEPAIAPPPPPLAPAPRPYGVRAFGIVRVSGEPLHFSGGGGLGLDAELLGPLALLVDVRAEQGSVGVSSLGDVRTSLVTAAALLALRAQFGLSHADFGAGIRGGMGLLEGASTSPGVQARSQLGAIASAVAQTDVSLHIAYAGYFHVGFEVGWIFVPVYGTDAASGAIVARIGGAQLAITVGFEVRPD